MLALLACAPEPVPAETASPAEDSAPDTGADSGSDTADTGDSAGDTASDTAVDTAPEGTDADGDGVSLEAGDCDDAHPWVYPGAEEWCDPVDHDCDGEPLASGVCAKDQDARALWTTSWTPDPAWADEGVYVAFGQPGGFVGDLDGDGKSEVLASCDNCSWFTTESGGSNAYLLPGGTTGRDLEPTSGAIGWWTGSEGYVPGVVMDLGDWNGDGVPDMAMTTGDDGYQEGVVRVLYGPPSRWPSGTEASAAADVRFYSTGAFGFGGLGIASGDFDGDGLSDIAASTYDDGWGWSPNAVWMLYGRSDAVTEPNVRDEPWLSLGDESVMLDYLSTGDVDGDGADDLVVATMDGGAFDFSLVSGSDFRNANGEDLGGASLVSFSAQGNGCLAAPGDLDGDGLADWIVGLNSSTSSHDDPGALYAVSGAHRGSGSAETFPEGAEGWWEGTVERAFGWQCGSGDVDGDGSEELLVLRGDIVTYRSTVYQWAVVPMRGVPAPGDALPTGLLLARVDPDELAMNQVPSIGDYDGDGFNDLLFSGYHDDDALSMGGLVIIPGWEIPWDEPAYW